MIRPRLGLFAVSAALLLAGCGGGASSNGVAKGSATQALGKVKTAMSSVKTVHVAGSVSLQGQSLGLDVHIANGRGQGTVTVNAAHFDARLVGGNVYVRGDAKALGAAGAPAAQATQLANKWIKEPVTQTGGFSSFGQFLDLAKIRASLLTPSGTVTKGAVTTINGTKALALVDNDKTNGGTLYVATTGRALPVRITRTGTGGHIDFTDYDAPLTVTAPAGAVDASTLSQ